MFKIVLKDEAARHLLNGHNKKTEGHVQNVNYDDQGRIRNLIVTIEGTGGYTSCFAPTDIDIRLSLRSAYKERKE